MYFLLYSMKKLLYHLFEKYVFSSIKYVLPSISNRRMAKYVFSSIIYVFPSISNKSASKMCLLAF